VISLRRYIHFVGEADQPAVTGLSAASKTPSPKPARRLPQQPASRATATADDAIPEVPARAGGAGQVPRCFQRPCKPAGMTVSSQARCAAPSACPRRHGGGPCQRCRVRARIGLPAMRAGERYRLPDDRQDARDRIHEPDCAKGRPLAPNSVRKLHFMLRAAFGMAVRWGWLTHNPAELASPPELSQRSPQPPMPEQVAELITAAWRQDEDFATLLWLAMTTGMRRGELCALRWLHVDLMTGDLLIERSFVQRAGQRKEKDTKTHQARRIALDEATVELLTAHRKRAEELAALAKLTLQPSAYVFSPDPGGGTPPVPDSITQRFGRLARRVGVPTSLHGFRHYTATQLLAAGVDLRTVAGRLGHGGGGATTLRVYASFVPAPDRRAADLLGGMLPRPGIESGEVAAEETPEPTAPPEGGGG